MADTDVPDRGHEAPPVHRALVWLMLDRPEAAERSVAGMDAATLRLWASVADRLSVMLFSLAERKRPAEFVPPIGLVPDPDRVPEAPIVEFEMNEGFEG